MNTRFCVRLTALSLILLTACLHDQDPPPAAQATLNLSPNSLSAAAGDTPTTFRAVVENSSDTVTWSLSGPGSLSAPSSTTTVYTPPGSVDGDVQYAVLTATLGRTGVSADAAITITEPPPAEPPTDPEPPTTPPTDPDPPTPPEPSEPEITITATPGGPVPWAVRYNVSANDIPGYEGPIYWDVSCRNDYGTVDVDEDTFICFHMAQNEEVYVEVFGVDGNVLLEKTLTAKVKASTGIAFKGKWSFGQQGDTTQTTIDSGDLTVGFPSDPYVENPNAEFYSIQYNPEGYVEGAKVEIYAQAWNYSDPVVPDPLADGTQRYIEPGNPTNPWRMEKLD